MHICSIRRLRHRWRRAGWLAVTTSLLTVGALPAARAALTENLAINPTAMSLGNAVTADPPGVDSIHFNPAGLARIKGNLEAHTFTVASIRTHASFRQGQDFNIGGWTDDPLDGTSTGPVRQKIFIPGYGMPGWRLPGVALATMGFAFNKDDSPFTFGTAVYPTMAMSVDRSTDPNDPGRFAGKLVNLQRLVYASPAVGYEISDTLRVGVSVPVAHASAVINTDMRMPNQLLGIVGKVQQGWCPENGGNILDTFTVGLCGGGEEGKINPFKKAANVDINMTAPVDPTINLGVLWEPTDWLGLGVVYQSGSRTKYSGKYRFETEPMLRAFVQGLNSSLLGPMVGAILGMPQSIPAVQKGNMTATIPFPKRWQVGVKLKPVDYLQFNVDANYADWGTWDALTLQFDQSIKLLEMARLFGIPDSTKLTIPRGYRRVLHWGFGLQTQVSDKLTLRFGYEPRKSSIPANRIDLVAPLPDTKVYSVGFNYKLSGGADISVAASYMTGDFKAPARSSCNMNCDNLFNIVYNPYAGLDVSGGIRVRYFALSYNKPF